MFWDYLHHHLKLVDAELHHDTDHEVQEEQLNDLDDALVTEQLMNHLRVVLQHLQLDDAVHDLIEEHHGAHVCHPGYEPPASIEQELAIRSVHLELDALLDLQLRLHEEREEVVYERAIEEVQFQEADLEVATIPP